MYSPNTHRERRIRGKKYSLSTIPGDFKGTVFVKKSIVGFTLVDYLFPAFGKNKLNGEKSIKQSICIMAHREIYSIYVLKGFEEAKKQFRAIFPTSDLFFGCSNMHDSLDFKSPCSLHVVGRERLQKCY